MNEAVIKGSANLQTSTANMEVIPKAPPDCPAGYHFNVFNLYNDDDCHISINGGDPIFYRANQGIKHESSYKTINSVVIVEDGITFNWTGTVY